MIRRTTTYLPNDYPRKHHRRIRMNNTITWTYPNSGTQYKKRAENAYRPSKPKVLNNPGTAQLYDNFPLSGIHLRRLSRHVNTGRSAGSEHPADIQTHHFADQHSNLRTFSDHLKMCKVPVCVRSMTIPQLV